MAESSNLKRLRAEIRATHDLVDLRSATGIDHLYLVFAKPTKTVNFTRWLDQEPGIVSCSSCSRTGHTVDGQLINHRIRVVKGKIEEYERCVILPAVTASGSRPSRTRRSPVPGAHRRSA